MVRRWILAGLLALAAGCDSGGDAAPAPAAITLPTYASTAEFSAFGRPVQVSKPAAAEVTDVPDGVRRLLAG